MYSRVDVPACLLTAGLAMAAAWSAVLDLHCGPEEGMLYCYVHVDVPPCLVTVGLAAACSWAMYFRVEVPACLLTVGLAMADELPLDGTSVWLTDASTDALAVASANLAGIGRAAQNVRIVEGSWFDAIPDGDRFDVIVSNPPYVAEGSVDAERIVTEWEPSSALFAGADGLDDLRVIIAQASDYLTEAGWLLVEHGHDQGVAVADLFASAGFVDVETRRDLAGLDRIGLGRRPG